MTAAECAYGLDILVNDESYYVREERRVNMFNDEGKIVILFEVVLENDVPVNLAAYQKCIDELNAVSPYNKSFS